MSVTYTPNINLGLQLDKTEYLDWDTITENWQKIDAASGGGTSHEVYPETLCFLPNSAALNPDILDINDADWQPCGKACSINWSSGSGGTGNFNVNPPVKALGVLVFAGAYVDALQETLGYPTDDGWILAHDPSIFAYPLDVSDYHYGIKVYTKMLDAGIQSVGFKTFKSEGGRTWAEQTSCALFCFYNASSITLSEDTLIEDEYNPPLSTGNQRVYLLFQNSISGMSWEVLNYNAGGEEMTNFTQSNGNGVLYGWQDYLPEYHQTPKFKYVGDGEHFPDANSAVGITIDVLW